MYLYIKTIHCIVKVNNKTCFHKWGRIKVYFHKLDYFAILRCHFITFITLLSLTMAPMPRHPHIVPRQSSSTLTWHFWTPLEILPGRRRAVIHCLTTNTLNTNIVDIKIEINMVICGIQIIDGDQKDDFPLWKVHKKMTLE